MRSRCTKWVGVDMRYNLERIEFKYDVWPLRTCPNFLSMVTKNQGNPNQKGIEKLPKRSQKYTAHFTILLFYLQCVLTFLYQLNHAGDFNSSFAPTKTS